MSRKRVPLNQNECTANFRIGVPFEQNLQLKEGNDYGIIKDHCLTEIKPEEDDGTTIVGVWFRPIPDEVSHLLSKKYQLYH